MSISYSREKDRQGMIVSLLVDLVGYVQWVYALPCNQRRHQQAHATLFHLTEVFYSSTPCVFIATLLAARCSLKKEGRAGNVAQWLSTCQAHVRPYIKPCWLFFRPMVAHTSNPSTWRLSRIATVQGYFSYIWVWGQSELQCETWPMKERKILQYMLPGEGAISGFIDFNFE